MEFPVGTKYMVVDCGGMLTMISFCCDMNVLSPLENVLKFMVL